MLIKILDALSAQQTVVVAGQEAVTGAAGTIAATGVAQQLLAANALRSGWLIQNRGSNPMYVNELGAAGVSNESFVVPVGGVFPPHGFPVSTGAVSVLGTSGDGFTVREW